MEKAKRIFLAGHDGMVGSAIYRNLLKRGYGNFSTRTFEELDLTKQNDVNSFFKREKPDYVIIAAAKVGGIVANNTYRAEFLYENLMIQNNVIHASWKQGVKKLLFLGSSCIYPKFAPQPLKEEYLLTDTLEYTNEPYAIAKIAGIKMCENYFKQYGCNFISVMPTNLYGRNDNYNLEKSHVLPALIRKMHIGKCLAAGDWQGLKRDLVKYPFDGIDEYSSQSAILEALRKFGIHPPNSKEKKVTIDLWGTGNVYREFLHVDDMAEACIYLMMNIDADTLYNKLKQTHINIGTGSDLTIRELANLVSKIVGFDGNINWDSTKPDGTPKKQLDVSLLHSLGWEHKIELARGVEMVYNTYKQ